MLFELLYMLRISDDGSGDHLTYGFYKVKFMQISNLLAYAGKDLEEQLRSVSSVDELMTRIPLAALLKIISSSNSRGDAGSHQLLLQSYASYLLTLHSEIKRIDTEWRKTQCVPREACVDVGKEFGAATNTFFKPPCVSVYRCGGCCNSEGQRCTNTSASYLSKAAKLYQRDGGLLSLLKKHAIFFKVRENKLSVFTNTNPSHPLKVERQAYFTRKMRLNVRFTDLRLPRTFFEALVPEYTPGALGQVLTVDILHPGMTEICPRSLITLTVVSLPFGNHARVEAGMAAVTESRKDAAELFEITVPLSQGPKPVTISFANHTSCRCMSKLDVYRQAHSIIRRSLPATLPHRIHFSEFRCQAANKTCPTDYIWNNHICRCLAQQDFIFSSNVGDDSADGFHDICGPNKELDEETCQCVCRGGLWPSSCGPHKELDRNSCQCVCKNKLFPSSCAANREFDENTCQCVCKRTCPRNQPLNPGKCACECTETPQKCFLKGKKFQHQTCSCYRRPCTNRVKHCEQGLSFSEEVCRCVPSYWKRPHMN
ncbi:hypothetical protein E2I00_001790 [Balaenoptera physalus]|uniref:Platelet-derived growth factor (PDGF) family profile domain-containing protein n=1 Tax=Balaenoptera physalus TaxID=9770 RepID=A0A643CDJ3_BALPH|nr:hypothetical protein E2I00_001790 [Balaenoptera physalus]